ncbi:MAG: adenylate/guanylate cyclase domain-containing protein [Sphingomonadaceae bacterium]|nr:adenylate/guanylate cyclase domain-containing protein [Sphingomonadaceae bacterium]
MTNVAADLARAALARGDLIAAYDVATAAIAEGDPGGTVRHQQVLALARMGDTERAMDLFAAYGLDRSTDPHERAIGARLLKDRALAAPAGEGRQLALARAYDAYHAIYLESGDSFPGINAATLALLAGDAAQSEALARALLDDPEVAAPRDYYKAATRAEALLLLGRTAEVTETLAGEAIRGSGDYGGRSTTLRQLAMVAAHLGISETERAALLAPLAPPRVAHFCGHMFGADADAEAQIRATVDDLLEQEGVGFAYGALACGADIVAAEALLDRGVELNVVLPFEEEDFLLQSVLPGGAGWEARYRACRDRAARLVYASPMAYFGNPAQYGYASRTAMGLARLRAEHLGAGAVQLAIWDGIASDGPAGTGADVAAWAAAGGRTRIVDPGAVERGLERPPPRVTTSYERALAAILFTDFKGFSTLSEAALPSFWDGVMGVVAEVLDAHESEVECRNSWGDALYAVASSAPVAAEIALQLQDRLARFDYATLGLDGSGGMRIGAHYGPAYRTRDHITGRITYYGTEVSKAARIEPVTPPGAVFVTEPFAAILALEARGRFTCRYVGRIPLAKKYGDYPMYRLSRAKPAA